MKTMSPPSQSILRNAIDNFNRACSLLDDPSYSPSLMRKLCRPAERIELNFSLVLEDGKLHHFRAFIVRHSDALGPAKGGIRMSPTVTRSDIAGLAMEMSWKCALIGVPFGGGKSGIVASPAVLSALDKERVIRGFARAAARHIDPLVYVPAPDMGTTERDMGHIKDSIAASRGHATTAGCYVTGKPVLLGGIPGRRNATGFGVAYCIEAAAAVLNLEPKQMTAVVQGLGNVGIATVQALDEMGVRVVGVGDVHQSNYNEDGLDLADLFAYLDSTGSLEGYRGGKAIDTQQLLQLPCDVLVPAATAGQITADNAGFIQARVIAEGANGPTTPDADRVLEDRGVLVIPDILCNAGGVFVSYLEYSQETQQEQTTEPEVMTRLRHRMRMTFDAVYHMAQLRGWSMRDAAMHLALTTVAEATTARGHLL